MSRARILADYVSSGVTAAEFDYMDGVTSNVQTQIDAAGPSGITDNSNANAMTIGVDESVTFSGDLIPSTPLSHRNIAINGGMQVWQRATSAVTASSSGYDTVDRWKFEESTDGSFTSEKHTMSAAELNTTGHATALKLVCTGVDASIAAGQYAYIHTNIEGQDLQHLQYGTANAETITLSFWVKAYVAGIYCIILRKIDSTTYHYVKEFTISSSNTWEQKTITITPTAPSGGTSLITSSPAAIANDNGQGFQLGFGLVWGSNYATATDDTWTASALYSTSNQVNFFTSTSNNFYLTGVQLELGSNATPFEHRSYGDELARCQRYYHKPDTGTTLGYGYVGGTGNDYRHLMYFFPVTMRSEPTITTDTWSAGSGAGSQLVHRHHVDLFVNSGNSSDTSILGTMTATAEL